MLKKAVWVLLSIALISGTQAWAKVAAFTHVDVNCIAVDNPLVPDAPEPPMGPTDDIIYFEDFESGAVGWEMVDLTDVSSWHVDDFNAYGGAGLSWWAGDTAIGGYDNHWLQYLVSPTLDLSGATSPTLSFHLFYAFEDTAGASAVIPPGTWDGWDGGNVWVSTDNGNTWDVLDMTTPAYTCQSMYSFGEEWGMGPGIAGWGGFSGSISPGVWLDAEASLAGYTTSTVKIRFALCSDPVWCTRDDSLLTGIFVDNILIEEGATRYLANNAQGIAIPSDLIPTPGIQPVGNFWHLSEPGFPTPPSPTHVMEMSDGMGSYVPDIYNAVVSPVIDLTGLSPDSGSVFCDFYVRGSINVNDPDPFPNLDNWTVQVSPDGGFAWYYYSNPWNQGMPNYVITNVPASYSLWSEIVTGGTIDLDPYIGYEIQVRIVFQADPDDYFGEGIFIDDFWVEYTTALAHDVAAEKMLVPMPTSAYFTDIHCSVELHNYGLNDENQVPAFYRVDGTPYALIPWASIPMGGMTLKEWDWLTPLPSSYFLDCYTQLSGDMNLANDTSKAGSVVITASDVLELGYDNRQYSYEPTYYYFNFGPGQGAYVRFTPQDDGIDSTLDGQNVKAIFRETGTIRVHIYEAGTASNPGPEVTSFDQAVITTFPNWQAFDITGVSYLQNALTDFWVWFEVIQSDSIPHITGWNEIIHGEGHFFANFNNQFGPSDYDFFARSVLSPALGVEDAAGATQPAVFALHQNTPNPFNPTTSIAFSLKAAGIAKLTVFDLMGRTVGVLADGSHAAGAHTVNFDASNLASGIYIYRLEADGKSIEKKMLFLK